MKKKFAVAMAAVLALSVAGCSGGGVQPILRKPR